MYHQNVLYRRKFYHICFYEIGEKILLHYLHFFESYTKTVSVCLWLLIICLKQTHSIEQT